MVKAAFYIPEIHKIMPQPRVVDFVIDTGADIALIGPADAVSTLGFPLGILTSDDAKTDLRYIYGIGGRSPCFSLDAAFGFRHVDGHADVIAASVRIMIPTPETDPLPSIIGWDILRQFAFRMDFSRSSILLDIPGGAI